MVTTLDKNNPALPPADPRPAHAGSVSKKRQTRSLGHKMGTLFQFVENKGAAEDGGGSFSPPPVFPHPFHPILIPFVLPLSSSFPEEYLRGACEAFA